MLIELIRNKSELACLEHEWNELLEESAADTIFLTWEWITSWIDVQDELPDIYVVITRDVGGRLTSIAPFYRTNYRLVECKDVSILRVLGDSMSGAEYGNIIVRNGHVNEVADILAQHLVAARKDWDIIWIPNFAKWTDSYSILERILQHDQLLLRERPCSFSSVPLPSDPDEFLQRASANRRQQIRRTCRKIFADQDMQVIQIHRDESLPFYLDTLFDLHKRRWSTKNDPGAFERIPRLKAFYRSFAPKAMKKGWLSIVALEAAGQAVAIQYGYLYKDNFLLLQEGFDPSRKNGLGTALRKSAIDLFIADSISEYDFLGGYSEHKRRWQAIEREGCDFFIANHRPLSRLLFYSGIWPTGRYLKHVS